MLCSRQTDLRSFLPLPSAEVTRSAGVGVLGGAGACQAKTNRCLLLQLQVQSLCIQSLTFDSGVYEEHLPSLQDLHLALDTRIARGLAMPPLLDIPA